MAWNENPFKNNIIITRSFSKEHGGESGGNFGLVKWFARLIYQFYHHRPRIHSTSLSLHSCFFSYSIFAKFKKLSEGWGCFIWKLQWDIYLNGLWRQKNHQHQITTRGIVISQYYSITHHTVNYSASILNFALRVTMVKHYPPPNLIFWELY